MVIARPNVGDLSRNELSGVALATSTGAGGNAMPAATERDFTEFATAGTVSSPMLLASISATIDSA